jgi:leucyl/phenylalanyl-tRNA--protein transferase
MAVFMIPDNEHIFPHPLVADESGILGVGGDLNPERLLLAYQFGIFPWYNKDEPILWWFPNPRCVLFPDDLKISKSMRPYFNQQKYEITMDQAFPAVVGQCKIAPRKGQNGTWIHDELADSYRRLYQMGYAHSVEVWESGKLAGGLYGLSLGKIFFGESMFSHSPNASKFGFISLVKFLESLGFWIIDCQQETRHLKSLGASMIDGTQFYTILRRNLVNQTLKDNWGIIFNTHSFQNDQ